MNGNRTANGETLSMSLWGVAVRAVQQEKQERMEDLSTQSFSRNIDWDLKQDSIINDYDNKFKYVSIGLYQRTRFYFHTLNSDDKAKIEALNEFLLSASSTLCDGRKIGHELPQLENLLAKHWWCKSLHKRLPTLHAVNEHMTGTPILGEFSPPLDRLSRRAYIEGCLCKLEEAFEVNGGGQFERDKWSIVINSCSKILEAILPHVESDQLIRLSELCRTSLDKTYQRDRRFHGTLVQKVDRDNLSSWEANHAQTDKMFLTSDLEAHLERAEMRRNYFKCLVDTFTAINVKFLPHKNPDHIREFLINDLGYIWLQDDQISKIIYDNIALVDQYNKS